MNNSLKDIIKSVEHEWKYSAENYINNIFLETFLPSHDLSHHQRCWEFAKVLLKDTIPAKAQINRKVIEGILLSCLFHDTGMVKSFAPEHGRESVKFYKEYIDNETEATPLLHRQICEAIKFHDKKDYDNPEAIRPDKPQEILSYLSLADDLDAIGAIGVYRYIEIYLLRETPLSELGKRIIDNVTKRFQFFLQTTISYPKLHEKWKPKYDDIITFFESYNYQLNVIDSIEKTHKGPIGVVNYIKKFSLENNIHPTNFRNELKHINPDIFTDAFFNKLHHELR